MGDCLVFLLGNCEKRDGVVEEEGGDVGDDGVLLVSFQTHVVVLFLFLEIQFLFSSLLVEIVLFGFLHFWVFLIFFLFPFLENWIELLLLPLLLLPFLSLLGEEFVERNH